MPERHFLLRVRCSTERPGQQGLAVGQAGHGGDAPLSLTPLSAPLRRWWRCRRRWRRATGQALRELASKLARKHAELDPR